MGEINKGEIQIDNGNLFSSGKIFEIREEPVMECALDLLYRLANSGMITLTAKGDAIPTAVAVANVLTENMMRGKSKIVDIIVDSESGAGKYGMTLISTIRITISKTS